MSVTFKNAPLVELIAELHWGENTPNPASGMPIPMQGVGPELDQFLMRLSGELYQRGFQRAERMVPAGFPVFPHQPIYRFRKEAADENSILFQSGAGLFSVHAVPPYRSWDTVSVVVRQGVEALLKARALGDGNQPFTRANLRYINAFGPKLTEGRTVDRFVEEVLGFSLNLPEAISRHVKDGCKPKPHLQFSFPLENSGSMAFLVAEGKINNIDSIIVDMTIISDSAIAADLDSIMAVFTNARNVIHNIFIDLTKPIQSLLEPVEETQNA